MPTCRHCHQMSHCCLSPCLSPQTLLCKRSSKGRIGWNFDSARSHSSQSRFLSVALSSCGTLWAHPLWGAGNSHHFQDAPAISLLSVTCALLPKSERGPPLPLLQGERDHSDDSLPLVFLWFRCAVVLQIFQLLTLSALWEVPFPVILQSLQELALPVNSSAGQLGQMRGADHNWRSGAGGALFERA